MPRSPTRPRGVLVWIASAQASYFATCEEPVQVVSVQSTGGNSKVRLRSLGDEPCTTRTFERILTDAVPDVGQRGSARWHFEDGLVAPGVVSSSEHVWLEGLETPALVCEVPSRVRVEDGAATLVPEAVPVAGCSPPDVLIDASMWLDGRVTVQKADGIWSVSHARAPAPGCVVYVERRGPRLLPVRRSVGCLADPPDLDLLWAPELPEAFHLVWSEGRGTVLETGQPVE